MIHGHQVIPWGDVDSLSSIASQLNCDILLSGHTHEASFNQTNGKYFINPGSATGAYTPLLIETTPSFSLLAAQSSEAQLFIYEFVDGNVETKQLTLSKQG